MQITIIIATMMGIALVKKLEVIFALVTFVPSAKLFVQWCSLVVLSERNNGRSGSMLYRILRSCNTVFLGAFLSSHRRSVGFTTGFKRLGMPAK
jgi:hypothetical protein